MRRLGDAAVVFDTFSWQTHILPPAMAAIADLLDELAADGPVSAERLEAAILEGAEPDPSASEMRELLRMLSEIGLLSS